MRRSLVREAEQWPIDESWLDRVRDELGHLPIKDDAALIEGVRHDEKLLRWFLASSAELRLHEVFGFRLHEITSLVPGTHRPSQSVVRGLLDAWSLAPGDDGGVADGESLVANPVVDRPFVASGLDRWYLFCLWIPMHNPFALIERLLDGQPELFEVYLERRADFLEERTARAFAAALPGATVERSVLSVDPIDGKQYENDVVVVIGSHAVVAEAKAGRFGPEARRGKGRPLRDRVEELIIRPSQQALRLATALEDGVGAQRFTRKADATSFDINCGEVRCALTVGVTLDPVADHLPRLAEVAHAGIADEAVDAISYSISLPDLELVADILEHPSEVLHWLERRQQIDRATWLSGDEMDLLGLYLRTGFNLGENEFDPALNLDVTGMSDPIDVWHYQQESGIQAQRPRVNRTSWWEACLTLVEQRRAPRWSEIALAMCHVATPEQREFLEAMHEFRAAVNGGTRDSTDFLLFHNGPPQRTTVFAGVIATSSSREERDQQFQLAAAAALDRSDGKPVVIMSWTPFPIESPYFAIAFADRPGA